MQIPRQPQAVIFDMDGVIFDTEILYQTSITQAAADMGRDLPGELYLQTIGLPFESAADVLRGHFGANFDVDALWSASHQNFVKLTADSHYLKDGIIGFLDLLDDAQLPRAIATSSKPDTAHRHLSHHGILDRFHQVVGNGDYARGKPSPDPFLKAAERLNVAPENCIALEDSHNGVRSASSAGMMTIMVPDLLEPTEPIRELCVGIADNLAHVGEVIGALLNR